MLIEEKGEEERYFCCKIRQVCNRLSATECCLGQVRAHVEKRIGLTVEGKAKKAAVVLPTQDHFAQKFRYFVMKTACKS